MKMLKKLYACIDLSNGSCGEKGHGYGYIWLFRTKKEAEFQRQVHELNDFHSLSEPVILHASKEKTEDTLFILTEESFFKYDNYCRFSYDEEDLSNFKRIYFNKTYSGLHKYVMQAS